MNKEQFEKSLISLAKGKKYFLSKNQFQIALAIELANVERGNGHEGACAYLDQKKNVMGEERKEKTISPDIVITREKFNGDVYRDGEELVYAECKYVVGGKFVEDESVVRQSSAKKPGIPGVRYDFWCDVERMEKVDPAGAAKKYVILLTNDERCWISGPTNQGSSDRELGFHNDRGDVPRNMIYYTSSKGKPVNKAIRLKGSYRLEKDAWKLYQDAGTKAAVVAMPLGKRDPDFRYLLLEVK